MERTVIFTVSDFKKWMGSCYSTFAIDTETTSLNYLELEIIGFSICDGDRACYVDLTWCDDSAHVLRLLRFYINDADVIIMHNAPFDMMVLKKYNIEIRRE